MLQQQSQGQGLLPVSPAGHDRFCSASLCTEWHACWKSNESYLIVYGQASYQQCIKVATHQEQAVAAAVTGSSGLQDRAGKFCSSSWCALT
jgi:hypothetical protein